MATNETIKTWTAGEIEELFAEEDRKADAANREATSGPFNPYGDAYESLVWVGTIETAWREEKWSRLAEDVNYTFMNDDGTAIGGGDWEENRAEIEAAALDLSDNVVGIGRPLVVAFSDGAYPYVFCEQADEDAVREAVGKHYDWSDPEPDADENEDA